MENNSNCRIDLNLLEKNIDLITKSLSRPYFNTALKRLQKDNPNNAKLLCDYVFVEQTEFNIKDSTKESKIKILVWLSNFHKGKNFIDMTKEDILEYLNSLRKSSNEDATHRWIGSYNGRQAVFLKFFKWLHFGNEPDFRKRDIPECILGIKKLNRIEKTPYKSTDIWDAREHALFLKYCPSKRDRCFHSVAIDMSARPGEILNLKIKDIRFFVTEEGKQYAEVRINDGKTGPRTVPLIDSIPYLKEWISEHPQGQNQESWLFISLSTTNKFGKFTYEGLSTKYEYYKKKFFPTLLKNENVPDGEKSYIKNLLLKPWNLYILRHSALTEKSQYLPEAILRSHAGWSMSSRMPQVYLHLSGESSKVLLQKRGIIKKEDTEISNALVSRQCPNCEEPNKKDNRFCVKCRMVLSYDSYEEVIIEEQQKKNFEILKLRDENRKNINSLKEDMDEKFKRVFALLQQNPQLIKIKPEVLCDKLR
ncbi:MAG TPA: tyrosine-type recombinase/integrase [Nitrososphaeraceae archaeon]|nr:tyrosine-type recombinase/integrase [Nitrososphaeraceae archaeon]